MKPQTDASRLVDFLREHPDTHLFWQSETGMWKLSTQSGTIIGYGDSPDEALDAAEKLLEPKQTECPFCSGTGKQPH